MGCCSTKNAEIARLTTQVAELEAELAGVDHAVALAYPPIDLDGFVDEAACNDGRRAGVIVLLRTGVRWTRRVGDGPERRQAQGVFLPLPQIDTTHFAEDSTSTYASGGAVRWVEHKLEQSGYLLTIDQTAMAEEGAGYGESWLPALVVDRKVAPFVANSVANAGALLKPFVGMKAILTWPYSD